VVPNTSQRVNFAAVAAIVVYALLLLMRRRLDENSNGDGTSLGAILSTIPPRRSFLDK
jgi:hypothetical protein